MEYETLINKLNDKINNINLTKEEEKTKYYSEYIELYDGSLDTFYLDKWKETLKTLTEIRLKYNSNKDFYVSVSKLFAQTYIPLMLQEYKVTDEDLKSKLSNIANGDGIKIFDRGEAQAYAKSFDEEINGDVGAFKFHDMICFTPDSENQELEVSSEESIVNAARMLSSMIHETMHFLIDVTKEEHFNYDVYSKTTSGGTILNEGLVEMYALDFSKKYNLIHLPALYYLNNVKMCRELKELYGEEEFKRLTFGGTYEDMIPTELLEQYKIAERIRYFNRNGHINVDPSKIDISETSKKVF